MIAFENTILVFIQKTTHHSHLQFLMLGKGSHHVPFSVSSGHSAKLLSLGLSLPQ